MALQRSVDEEFIDTKCLWNKDIDPRYLIAGPKQETLRESRHRRMRIKIGRIAILIRFWDTISSAEMLRRAPRGEYFVLRLFSR